MNLSIAHDDTIRTINDNDNYKFSAYAYSVSHEFVVEIEVVITSHHEVVREIHVRHTDSSKVLKRFAFITDELNVPWDLGIRLTFSRDDSP